jgi:hypothetical protein
MSALESKIERDVCDYAKKAGMLVFKFVSPGNRGVPDRIWINQYGEVYFVEFKTEKGRVSPLQQVWINRLRKHHKQVHIVRSVEEGKRLVDLLRDML